MGGHWMEAWESGKSFEVSPADSYGRCQRLRWKCGYQQIFSLYHYALSGQPVRQHP